jgi:hypothetical protein
MNSLSGCLYNDSISVSYEMKSIKYVWKNDEDVLKKSASLATLNAYLIKNQTLECNWNNNWRGKSQLHVFKY